MYQFPFLFVLMLVKAIELISWPAKESQPAVWKTLERNLPITLLPDVTHHWLWQWRCLHSTHSSTLCLWVSCLSRVAAQAGVLAAWSGLTSLSSSKAWDSYDILDPPPAIPYGLPTLPFYSQLPFCEYIWFPNEKKMELTFTKPGSWTRVLHIISLSPINSRNLVLSPILSWLWGLSTLSSY